MQRCLGPFAGMHLLVLLLGLLAPTVPAVWAQDQAAALRGFVKDASNGEALPGVNVVAVGPEGERLGVATGRDGSYILTRLRPGRYAVHASFVGYTPYVDTLRLAADERRLLNITLEPSAEALDEVVVESEGRVGPSQLVAGQQTVRPRELDLIPSPGVGGDLAGYLTTHPGVVTSGDQGGQFFIRGGEPTQNLVLLDGMLVYQPFHLLGFFSVIPSEILRDADLYAGGFGSRFGGRLSSVIDVAARTGNANRFAGSVTLAPFVSALHLEGPIDPGGRTTFLLSGRQSVLEQGAAQYLDAPLPFTFGDAFAKIQSQVTRNSQLSLTGLMSYDEGIVGQDTGGEAPDDVAWRNAAVGARYVVLPSSFPVLAEIQISGSRFETELGPGTPTERSSSVGRLSAEVHITHFSGDTEVRWGLFARTLELDSELRGLYQNVSLSREYVTEAGLYAEPVFQVTDALSVTTGLRVHTFPSKSGAKIEPRLRAVWERGAHRVSAAAGVYHQEIIGLNDRRDAASVFTVWSATPFDVPRAVHVMGGYSVTPAPWLDLSVEGYWKTLDDLFVGEWTALPRFTTRLQPAEGRVVGLDLRAEAQGRGLYGYVSYGLSSVEYEAGQRALALWFGESTLRYRPPHDRRHQVNVVGGTTVAGIDLSARWQFGSGLPFSRALGFDGFILMDGAVDVFTATGDRRVIYERPYNGVLPTYHRLDVSAERTFRLGGADLTLEGSVINVYDRRNLFYLDVFTLQRVDQLPVLPSFGIKLAFE